MDHTIIKEAATKIVANIKAMEDDITVLRNKQDIISTSDTTMTGSYPGRLSIEEIGGKCEQFTTTGKSLVDFTKGRTSTNGGVTYTLQPDGSFKRTGTATTDTGNVWMMGNWALEPTDDTTLVTLEAGKHYYVVDCVVFSNQAVIYASDNVLYVDPNRYPDGFKVTGIRNDFFEIGKTYNDTIYPLICERTEGIDWEPYTGGQPSPNPDYPQEIKKTVVSGIKTHGKNLVEIDTVSKIESGVTFTVNADGSVTLKGTSTDTIYFILKSNFTIPANTIMSGCPSDGSVESYLLAATFYDHYTKHDFGSGILLHDTEMSCRNFYIQVMSGVTVDTTFYPMIRKADVKDDTYEPYTESAITLSQPIELYGIGDVQDTITPNQIKRKYKEVALNGNEYIEQNLVADADGHYFHMSVSGIKPNDYSWTSANAYCTRLKQENPSYLWNNDCDGFAIDNTTGNDSQRIRMRFSTGSGLNTIDSLKVKLAEWNTEGYPLTFVLELAEEVTEELPLVDQAALNSLKTYDGITYVEIDSEIEPTFKAEYGATKLGGYTLEGILAGANGVSLGQSNTDRITALEATLVNNI